MKVKAHAQMDKVITRCHKGYSRAIKLQDSAGNKSTINI